MWKTEVERAKVAGFKKIMIIFLGERLHNIIEKNMLKNGCYVFHNLLEILLFNHSN